MVSEMEGTSPCSSSVTLAVNPIINHERGNTVMVNHKTDIP
jgi:hypothetical protein